MKNHEINIKNAVINHADINLVKATATLDAEGLQKATDEICAYINHFASSIFQQLYDMTFEGKEENMDESKRFIDRSDLLWLAKECGAQIDL